MKVLNLWPFLSSPCINSPSSFHPVCLFSAVCSSSPRTLSLSVCVCVWERERVWVWERESVGEVSRFFRCLGCCSLECLEYFACLSLDFCNECECLISHLGPYQSVKSAYIIRDYINVFYIPSRNNLMQKLEEFYIFCTDLCCMWQLKFTFSSENVIIKCYIFNLVNF